MDKRLPSTLDAGHCARSVQGRDVDVNKGCKCFVVKVKKVQVCYWKPRPNSFQILYSCFNFNKQIKMLVMQRLALRQPIFFFTVVFVIDPII